MRTASLQPYVQDKLAACAIEQIPKEGYFPKSGMVRVATLATICTMGNEASAP